MSAKIELCTSINNAKAIEIDKLVDAINSSEKHIEDLEGNMRIIAKLMCLKRNWRRMRKILKWRKRYYRDKSCWDPLDDKILPGSSGSNTIYKIEYILGGGEPPIVIKEFSYPTQKSVRSRNAAIAKRLLLLLLAQKPVEDDEVDKARKKVLEAEEKL